LRAYDPCLSCSTHASNPYSVEVELVDTDGSVVDSIRR
jgi:NAD-reducing hydrogenase large subunit